jgi:hypothetical protein
MILHTSLRTRGRLHSFPITTWEEIYYCVRKDKSKFYLYELPYLFFSLPLTDRDLPKKEGTMKKKVL